MKKTYQKNHPETIQSLFGSIAKNYDRTNAILSLNLHKRWNRALAGCISGSGHPKRYLDLCAGTGEIAYTVLKNASRPIEVFLLDFCPEMLECAKEKEKTEPMPQHRIHYLHADAQEIPLPSESIDCATMAYGIRNINKPSACIAEVFRVLTPGGRFAILELTRPKNPLLRMGHTLYLKTVLPIVGKLATDNKDAYRYLRDSIGSFISPEEIEEILVAAGFKHTTNTPLAGGIATLIQGYK